MDWCCDCGLWTAWASLPHRLRSTHVGMAVQVDVHLGELRAIADCACKDRERSISPAT